MGARNLLRGAFAACLIAATTGCIQFPPPDVKVRERDLSFLQPGLSTRDEVLDRLGQPNIVDGKRVSVYEWWTRQGFAIPLLPVRGTATGSNHSRLLVDFDETGKVRRFAFAEYRYPGLTSNEDPGSYFVDGIDRDLPRPAAGLLKPRPLLGGGGFASRPYEALTISSDGRYVAVAPGAGGIEVWDLSTGTDRSLASGLSTHVARVIDVSSDGRILAAGFDDAAVLWDMATGARLHVIKGVGKPPTVFDSSGPTTLELAPHGRTLATGGYDGTIRFWDVASGKETSSISIGRGVVESLAFAPQGDLLAAGTSRGDVLVFDLVEGKQARILQGSDSLDFSSGDSPPVGGEAVFGGRTVAFSPSGRMLAANDCVAVELWRVSDIREQIGPLATPGPSAGADKQQEPATAFLLPYGRAPGCRRGERTSIAFSPDDDVLIASSNLYSVWDLRSRRLLAVWDPSRDAAQAADLTLGPGAALLAWSYAQPTWSGSQGKGIQVIDLAPIVREAMGR